MLLGAELEGSSLSGRPDARRRRLSWRRHYPGRGSGSELAVSPAGPAATGWGVVLLRGEERGARGGGRGSRGETNLAEGGGGGGGGCAHKPGQLFDTRTAPPVPAPRPATPRRRPATPPPRVSPPGPGSPLRLYATQSNRVRAAAGAPRAAPLRSTPSHSVTQWAHAVPNHNTT